MVKKKQVTSDVISIVAEQGAFTFITRKEWHDLPECCMATLNNHITVMSFNGTDSTYFLLKDICPLDYLKEYGINHKLVKVYVDGEGKQKLSVMNLCQAEAEQMIKNRIAIFE